MSGIRGLASLGAALALSTQSLTAQGPATMQLIEGIRSVESEARSKANLPPTQPNLADRVLGLHGRMTVRGFDATPIAGSFVNVSSGGGTVIPPAQLTPPDLGVDFFGDNPPTGFCNFRYPVGGPYPPPVPACNDTVTLIRVPIGMQAKICEHDGVGSTGFGLCKEYPAGDNTAGELNDKGTTFWVTDNGSYFYFTSADDEVGTSSVGVHVSHDDQGHTSFGLDLTVDGPWHQKTYTLALPQWCLNPSIWEATRNNDARWSSHITGSGSSKTLTLTLEVQERAIFGAANWVGVGVRCKP